MNKSEWEPKEIKIKAEFANVMGFAVEADMRHVNLVFGQQTYDRVDEDGKAVWKNGKVIPVSKIVIPTTQFGNMVNLFQKSANEAKEVLDFEARVVEGE